MTPSTLRQSGFTHLGAIDGNQIYALQMQHAGRLVEVKLFVKGDNHCTRVPAEIGDEGAWRLFDEVESRLNLI